MVIRQLRFIRFNWRLFNRKFKSQTDPLCDFLSKLHVFFQLGIDVSDLFVRVPHPEVFKVLWNIVLAEPRQAKAPEGMSTILRLIKFGQDRMQRAPQDIRLPELLAGSGAE